MSRSQLCLCTFTFRPRRSPLVWCIKIPSAYVVAQAACFPNEELRLNVVAVQRSPCGEEGGGALWSGPDPNVCSSHNIRMWETDRKNNNGKNGDLGFSFQHLWVSILFLLTTLDHRTQEPKWLVNEISVSVWLLLSLLSSSSRLFPLCVALQVLWNRRWGSRRRSAAVSWDELVLCLGAVYACCRHQGPLERTSHPRRHPSQVFALPYLAVSPKYHVHWLKPSSLRLAVMETRWCWVFRFCLFIKVECWLVFYPGARVSLCRHVRVPPISDCALILYMN